jgi:hypothetical protein
MRLLWAVWLECGPGSPEGRSQAELRPDRPKALASLPAPAPASHRPNEAIRLLARGGFGHAEMAQFTFADLEAFVDFAGALAWPSWQKSMATNWSQQRRLRAWRSPGLRRAISSNSGPGTKRRSSLKMLNPLDKAGGPRWAESILAGNVSLP